MKDYLSNSERGEIVSIIKNADLLMNYAGEKSKVFNATEKKYLKTAATYITKAISGKIGKDGKPIKEEGIGILYRLNKDAAKAFCRSIENTQLFITDKSEIEIYKKRVRSELNAAYEESKDYFNLVENVIDINCKNCTKCGSECPFYKMFESKCIPEFDGVEHLDNCKYAYKETKAVTKP